VARRIVGKTKNPAVINASSGDLIDPTSMTSAVWNKTSIIPAALAFPFNIRIMAVKADIQDVPVEKKECNNPIFFV